MENQSSPAFASGTDDTRLETMWFNVMSTFNLPLFSSAPLRNRRSAQGDRLSAITMALQYESDEEGILSGTTLT